MNVGILYALSAAILFGISTPLAKRLVDEISPTLLAGLLYGGAGMGLSAWVLLRYLSRSKAPIVPLARQDAPWLAGAVVAGGIIAPVLLLIGLTRTPAASASLLLNLEGVFTALLAWFVFQEPVDRRIALGMGFIVTAGVLLSWPESHGSVLPWGSGCIVAACLGWGIDNNLTRQVSAGDPVQIAAIKGGVAGIVNIGIAWAMGASWPAWPIMAQAATVGLASYGVSLVLFVLALRHLGTARTGAYFSIAPFVGALVSLLLWQESPPPGFWIAAGLMGLGIGLHVTERHAHPHTHEKMTHAHRHVHDAHHQHAHDFPWDGVEPHTHCHRHALTHSHPHYPDIHHRHNHPFK